MCQDCFYKVVFPGSIRQPVFIKKTDLDVPKPNNTGRVVPLRTSCGRIEHWVSAIDFDELFPTSGVSINNSSSPIMNRKISIIETI